MRELARLASGAAALALVAAGASCSQENPQEPQTQAHQQTQPPRAQQQAQDPAQQAELQPHEMRQAQNRPQPIRHAVYQNVDQNGTQDAVENPGRAATREIQQALERKGFKVGRLDGKLGPRTRWALRQFQRQQALQRTGMPDEQTLAALGIGNEARTTGQGRSASGGMNSSESPSNYPITRSPQ